MKKLTNTQKILAALKSGPKTQADLVRETKVKNVYQIIAGLKKKKLVFMDTGKGVNLMKVPIAVDKTDKVSAEQLSATLSKPESEIRRVLQEREERLKREALSKVYKFDGKIVLDRVSFIQHEIDNINDGVRSLMVARSYLLRRIEEEKREAYEEEKRREKRDA